jgi:hypothetical protein
MIGLPLDPKETFLENLQQIRELAGKGSLKGLQILTNKGVADAYRGKSKKDQHVAVAKAGQASALQMVKGNTQDSPKLWLWKAKKQAKKKRDWKQRSS